MTRLYSRLNTSKMTRLIQHLLGLIVGIPTWQQGASPKALAKAPFVLLLASHPICPSVNALPLSHLTENHRFLLSASPCPHYPIPRPPSGNRPWREARICDVNTLSAVSGPQCSALSRRFGTTNTQLRSLVGDVVHGVLSGIRHNSSAPVPRNTPHSEGSRPEEGGRRAHGE